MKITELMVGDWVLMDMNYSEENPMYTKPDYQPYKIQNGEDIDLAYETNCIGNANVYQSIPLTQEILKKNGFVNTQYYGELLIGPWQIQCDCIKLRARDGIQSINIYCAYVHQLQHALKLCGIEKEIKV